MNTLETEQIKFPILEENEVKSKPKERNLDLVLDLPLSVTVELGRTKKLLKEILEMNKGSIVELDKLVEEPVDILVNGNVVAKGEVVVIDENFGVRITEIKQKSLNI